MSYTHSNTIVFLVALLLVNTLCLSNEKAKSLRCRTTQPDTPIQTNPIPIPTPIPMPMPTPVPIQPPFTTGAIIPPQPTPAPENPKPAQNGYGNVRYVEVRSNPEEWQGVLQLYALIVRNEKMENIAKGKKFTASPQHVNYNQGGPAMVLNGREESNYGDLCYSGNEQGNDVSHQFFRVDLGANSFVKQVEVWNRVNLSYRQIGVTVALLDENMKEIVVSDPLEDDRDLTIVDFKRRPVPKKYSDTKLVEGKCEGQASTAGVRYVKLLSRQSTKPNKEANHFSFSQLAVYDKNGVNVAVKKPCSVSSRNHRTTPFYQCQTALDGVMTPRPWGNHFSAGYSYKEWFLVDLESTQEISKVLIVNDSEINDRFWVGNSIPGSIVQLLDENKDILKEYKLALSQKLQEVCVVAN